MSTNSSNISPLSMEPSALRHLTDAQKQRLTDILERYMLSLEKGEPLSTESLMGQNPDLADSLQTYFASLDDLHGIAAGFGGGTKAGGELPEEDIEGGEKRIGDFKLIREIGRGGMGVVYEAYQVSLGRRIALKILPFAAVLDSKQIARFKNEAQAAAQLHHPNIVPVFAIGAERGVHYYAMQFIDGLSLDRVIDELREYRQLGKKSPLNVPHENRASVATVKVTAEAVDTVFDELGPTKDSPPRSLAAVRQCANINTVVRLGIQAAEALHAAHEYGVVHRDIKPSNLMLDGNGKLWVTDFGLARFQTDMSLTQTGDVVGTWRYMSPEQAAGQTALVDHRTDIYSLGITLYELLVLQPAFADREGQALPRRDSQEMPRALRKLRPNVPVDLETVIMKAISIARDARYPSAEALAGDLQRVLEGIPTLARPPTILERVSRFALRHRRFATVIAAAALLAVISLAVGAVVVFREKARAEQNFERAERNFRDAREAVDRFGARLAERLADVPGATQVRQELLQETLQYYRQFVEQAKGDPALRAELAVTYSKVGSLAAEIGSSKDEIAAHRAARELFEQLVREEPNDPLHVRRLAQCYNNLGLVLGRTGQTDEALDAYGQAIQLQERLVAAHPKDEQYAADLALSHSNLGLLYGETNRPAEAETAFKSAIRWQEKLVQVHPDHPDHRRGLAASFNNMAALYVEKQPAVAGRYYRLALNQQTALVTARPEVAKYRSELALTYNNLGALQSRSNLFADSVASYEESIRIQKELVKQSPLQKSSRHDLAVGYNNLGLVQSRLGKSSDAEQSFQTALDMHNELLSQYPDDVVLQSSLGGVYNNLGNAFEEAEQFVKAADAYRNAVEHQRLAYERAGQVARYRTFLSKHYFNYGRVLRRIGRGDEAARIALERKQLWPGSPDRLYSVAEEFALACQSFNSPSSGRMTSDQCAELAVETLEQAVAAGFVLPADIARKEPFAAIRNNARFVHLVNR